MIKTFEDGMSSLKLLASLLAMTLISASAFAVERPFKVEAENLPNLAFEALLERYPQISAGAVELDSRIFFNCHANPSIAGSSRIRFSTLSCMATVNFNVSGSGIEYFYTDAQGNCRVLRPDTATVRFSPDGSRRVLFHPTNLSEGNHIDCDDEAITQIALTNQRTPAVEGAFSVDAAGILEQAFQAASRDYSDIPEEQIVYGDGPGLSVTCHANAAGNGLTPGKSTIDDCSARVRLADESVKVDYRYVRNDRCMVGRATDWITVRIDPQGFAETRASRNSAAGRAHSVACNEAFEQSPLPLITSQEMAN